MSVVLQIIGVLIGLILMCGIAATPINKYIDIIREKIVFTPKPVILPIEPITTPEPRPMQIEKYPEIRNFLNNLPDCKWCVACGSYARYTRLEAEKQGIAIKEHRMHFKIEGHPFVDGHQLNYFYDDNGNRIYIDNSGNQRKILEDCTLKQHMKDVYDLDI